MNVFVPVIMFFTVNVCDPIYALKKKKERKKKD